MSYPYHMALWDRAQRQAMLRKAVKERQAAVAAYVQSNTPKGASGCSQAVIGMEPNDTKAGAK